MASAATYPTAEGGDAAEGGKSVLDTIVYESKVLGKTARLLGRMVFVGAMAPEHVDEVKGWAAAAAKELGAGAGPGPGVTGCCVVYQDAFLLAIEAPVKDLDTFVRTLRDAEADGGLMHSVRVVASSQDVPRAYFPGWDTVESSDLQATAKSDGVEVPAARALSDANLAMLGLGDVLRGLEGSDRVEQVSDLGARPSPSVPPYAVARGLLLLDEPCTVGEYAELFCRPMPLELDGDTVWPIATEPVF